MSRSFRTSGSPCASVGIRTTGGWTLAANSPGRITRIATDLFKGGNSPPVREVNHRETDDLFPSFAVTLSGMRNCTTCIGASMLTP